MDLETHALTTIPTILDTHPDPKPWSQIRGGMDGRLYLQSYLPRTTALDETKLAIINRYDLQSQVWTDIPILRSWLTRIPDDAYISTKFIIGVNESGFIYYGMDWSDPASGSPHIDVLKISPAGELIWHITEMEMGSLSLPLRLLANDYFLLDDGNDFEIAPLQDINKCLTPSSTEQLIMALKQATDTTTICLVSGATYTLDTFQTDFFGKTGLPPIRNWIIIEGNGATIERATTAPDFFRLFGVDDGNLTLKNLTLRGGIIDQNAGAALVNVGGKVTLENVTIADNVAVSQGGGIYNYGGTMVITSSRFMGNTAMVGAGALFNWGGRVTISNSCFTNNTAPDGFSVKQLDGTTNAPNNWWGSADGPAGSGAGQGDGVNEGIVFDPFLTTAPLHCGGTPIEPTPTSFEATSSETLAELLSAPNCSSACWLGITPGDLETTIEEQLTAANIEFSKEEFGISGDMFSYDITEDYFHPLVRSDIPITIFAGQGYVAVIYIFVKDLSVNDVIHTYGDPTMLVETGAASVTFVYPQYGLAFSVLRENSDFIDRIQITSAEGIINGYINNAYFDIFPPCTDATQLCAITTATPTPVVTPTSHP
jgi:hypothetical protein